MDLDLNSEVAWRTTPDRSVAECAVCGGEGIGWGCYGCDLEAGPCDACHSEGLDEGCVECGRDASHSPYRTVEDTMILEEGPAGGSGV